MRNRNAVKRAVRNFVIAIAVMILAGCGQNPGGDYTSSSPILPAVADTAGSSLDLTIPLNVAVAASNPQRFAVRGKYIAIDPGSTGQANLRLNSISDTSRLAYPGSTFNPGDFTDLYFDYQAQPGKFLHVLYGNSPDILSAGIKSISDPALPSNAYINTLAATNEVDIVTAAQNVNGVKILGGTLSSLTGSAAAQQSNASYIRIWPGGIGIFFAVVGTTNAQNPVVNNIDYKTIPIPQIYVPPGARITFGSVCLPGGGVSSHIVLNYQIL